MAVQKKFYTKCVFKRRVKGKFCLLWCSQQESMVCPAPGPAPALPHTSHPVLPCRGSQGLLYRHAWPVPPPQLLKPSYKLRPTGYPSSSLCVQPRYIISVLGPNLKQLKFPKYRETAPLEDDQQPTSKSLSIIQWLRQKFLLQEMVINKWWKIRCWYTQA